MLRIKKYKDSEESKTSWTSGKFKESGEVKQSKKSNVLKNKTFKDILQKDHENNENQNNIII